MVIIVGACQQGSTPQAGKGDVRALQNATSPTGGDSINSTPSDINSVGTGFCNQESNYSHPLCSLVLVSYSGNFFFSLPKVPINIDGTFQNNFWPNGKLKSVTFYKKGDFQNPQGSYNYSYTPDGKLLMEVALIASQDDGNFDVQRLRHYLYEQGNIKSFVETLGPIGFRDLAPTQWTERQYHYPGDPLHFGEAYDRIIITTLSESSGPGSPTTIKAQIAEEMTVNEQEKPLESLVRNLYFARGEVKEYSYTDGKLSKMLHKFYDCSSQFANDCFNGTKPFVLNPELEPYQTVTTEWFFEEGKLKKITSAIDGDVNHESPTTLSDGTPNYEWYCTFTYEDTPYPVVAALAPEFEQIGIKPEHKIKTLTCDDFGQGKFSVDFTFDKWAYLWQTLPGAPEPTQ